jgi:hypothetical protein
VKKITRYKAYSLAIKAIEDSIKKIIFDANMARTFGRDFSIRATRALDQHEEFESAIERLRDDYEILEDKPL